MRTDRFDAALANYLDTLHAVSVGMCSLYLHWPAYVAYLMRNSR